MTAEQDPAPRSRRKPHIIFVCSRWYPNFAGPAAYVRRTLTTLLEAFDDELSIVTVVRPNHIRPEPPRLPKGFFTIMRPFIWLPLGLGSEVGGAWLAVRAWWLGIQRSRRSILYFTGGHVSAGWRTAAILGKPLGVTVIVECVLVGADDAASLLRARWPVLTRIAVRLVAYFSTISSALTSSFKRDLPNARVVYNPYGVDTELFCPTTLDERRSQREALGLQEKDFVGLFVGNVSPRKDVLSLVEAWLESASRRPEIYWHLLIVGHYEPASEYTQLIQQRLAEGRDNARVWLLGARDDIPSIMHACDVYVSASTAEGLGLANVEALASGLPVVCRHLPGITEDMTYGEAVAGIRQWRPETFASAIERITDIQHWNRCSTDARTVAVERFALSSRIERLLALSQRSNS